MPRTETTPTLLSDGTFQNPSGNRRLDLSRHVHFTIAIHTKHVHAVLVELPALFDFLHHPFHNLFTFLFSFFTFILVGCFFTPLCYPFVVFLCAKVIPLQCVRTQHAEFLRYKPFIFDLRQRH